MKLLHSVTICTDIIGSAPVKKIGSFRVIK
jgi:hypothetical protein